MSRKDYEMTARILRDEMMRHPSASQGAQVLYRLALDFAWYYKKDNSRFDIEKFMSACGMSKEWSA